MRFEYELQKEVTISIFLALFTFVLLILFYDIFIHLVSIWLDINVEPLKIFVINTNILFPLL